ncbi:diguanylate cyclase [Bradyrhizobium sp. NAS96.2]|uniref:diguanylate cyclase domain-containing protein n=1 Tax=Bradyrhizobium sp. NAS96.2 TaxID=1680160 RepID=UPI00093E24CB|nr:diguanylate cyclase [Bradyrhizobium sp. NAS96.2]OKO79777.1 diguanylate cyclase [Bradyrhizobium sp. NAS96.2]
MTLAAAAFVALACVAIIALSCWREWSSRQLELKNAETDMANLARSLTQHAEDTFELTDTVLNVLVNQFELEGTGPAAVAKVQAFLARRRAVNRIHGVFVYDETGRWLATSEPVTFTNLNNSDREYFQHHRASAERGTYIGRPVKSRSGGQWIITASRRFNHPDGSFAGVALTTIDVGYFLQFYHGFDIGPNGSIALATADGTILARSPDDGSYTGRDLSGAPLFRNLRERPAEGAYYFRSPLDDVQRLSFYKLSNRYPVIVVATQSEDDVLAPWRRAALSRMAVVVALIGALGSAGLLLVRQLRRGQKMAAAISAKEADFRLLAEHSGDMVTRISLEGRIRYVSPSSSRLLGWAPNQLLDTPALAGVNANDLPQVEQTVSFLRTGQAEEARIIYRNRHREKGEIWLETALRVTRNPKSGEIDGVVAISRDMTEHKDLEDKLAVLASSDGLTGLANRRHFDEQLESEWERAKREGTPLSLLLLDVDHFKKFNDQYGHQAGDGCLRSVARVLSEQARRPADVAARYGGEEFALLLPNTDAAGCAQVGERIRQAIRDLGILHALNPPSRLITLSLGGATHLPASDKLHCASLIEAADKALYAAKECGRDRLVMSGQVIAWPTSIRA